MDEVLADHCGHVCQESISSRPNTIVSRSWKVRSKPTLKTFGGHSSADEMARCT